MDKLVSQNAQHQNKQQDTRHHNAQQNVPQQNAQHDVRAQNAQRHLIIGTAGHIDHGKSTLIKALTGTDPDRLAEEKKRGITIELGFAQLLLPDGTIAGIVDVPGHEKFIRQMIAGATGIDIALVCVAADDGIMPQTREHLAVLELLGVTTCVVALTKCDLVDSEWLELVKEEITAELASSSFNEAPIVAVSAREGQGLDELKEVLSKSVATSPTPDLTGPARMPVDRVFTIKGAGTVVTGTLWQGTIRPDDELELLPKGISARIRSIQVHDKEVEHSSAGTRTALNLANLSTKEIRPGDFLITPQTLNSSDRFDARFTYLPLLSAQKPFISGTSVRIAHGTRETMGRILLMDNQTSLEPRQTAFAQIRLNEPLPLSHGDHFIVRLLSPARVIGGGVVLNGHPRRRTILSDEEKTLLEALDRNDREEIARALIDTSPVPLGINAIVNLTGFSNEQIIQSLSAHTTGKGKPLYQRIGKDPQLFFARKPLIQKQLSVLENILLTFHANNPSKIGISKGALEKQLPYHLDHQCFEALLDEALKQGKLAISKGEISHPQAGIQARTLEEQAAQTLDSLLLSYGTTPPPIAELFAEAGLDTAQGAKALARLENQRKAQRISKTLCFPKATLDDFWNSAKTYLQEHRSASAAQLKEAMGTSRKYAIPLLEYFDQKNLTIRQEDLRVLSKSFEK